MRLVPLALVAALSGTAALAEGFPVTLSHAFGETTVPAQPERVVSIGLNDQDFLYALGVAPVGVREWWGEQPYATWPWAEDERLALGAEPAVHGAGDLNVEWVASLEPDLIVAVYSEVNAETYALLTEIAPVVLRGAEFPEYGAPWQEQFRQIALATTGSTAAADDSIAAIDAATEALRAANPGFAGHTGTAADYRDGQFTLWAREHAPTRFVESLGLTFPEELNALAGPDGWIYLSPENIAQMDLDVVIWPNGKADEIGALSVYDSSRMGREGRSVFLSGETGTLPAALWFQTPLSIPYVLERVAPMVEAALDGDPATVVEAE